MERIKIRITDDKMHIVDLDGNEFGEKHEWEKEAVSVECWYDRHYRHWVIYPVDVEGNQLDEPRYGFGKKEALEIKSEIESEIANGKKYAW